MLQLKYGIGHPPAVIRIPYDQDLYVSRDHPLRGHSNGDLVLDLHVYIELHHHIPVEVVLYYKQAPDHHDQCAVQNCEELAGWSFDHAQPNFAIAKDRGWPVTNNGGQ